MKLTENAPFLYSHLLIILFLHTTSHHLKNAQKNVQQANFYVILEQLQTKLRKCTLSYGTSLSHFCTLHLRHSTVHCKKYSKMHQKICSRQTLMLYNAAATNYTYKLPRKCTHLCTSSSHYTYTSL